MDDKDVRVKKVLMVAFHFPPQAGSSGVQRTLRFVQHLPALGWQPLVLTANTLAYDQTNSHLLADVPAGTVVRRALALDTARHLQVAGRYWAAMARPDRWMSWRWDAVRQGLAMVRAFKPDAIWSTYPIATAHVIGAELARQTRLPWVADFRDPMAQEGYPSDPRTWQAFERIEATAARQARWCVFTTPSAACLYQQRYPQAAQRMMVLENGYDEESFLQAGALDAPRLLATDLPAVRNRPALLLHSGIVYPSERDPAALFVALGQLAQSGAVGPEDLMIRFRAAVHEDLLRDLAMRHNVQALVEICPALPYREALAEMLNADTLLLMQASNCNAQIPAKFYEYLRAGKPLLGLTDPAGDTAAAMRSAGLSDTARLDNAPEIAQALQQLLRELRLGQAARPGLSAIQQASRTARAQTLAQMLNEASSEKSP